MLEWRAVDFGWGGSPWVNAPCRWSRFALAIHRAMILKARLAVRRCRLLVKLHEGYCINVDLSFPEPSHALGIWNVGRVHWLTPLGMPASLDWKKKEVFSPSENIMCPPGRGEKACRQQGLPSPICVGVAYTWSFPQEMEHSISPNILGSKADCWVSPPAQQVHSASRCCVLTVPSEPGSLMILFRTSCWISL